MRRAKSQFFFCFASDWLRGGAGGWTNHEGRRSLTRAIQNYLTHITKRPAISGLLHRNATKIHQWRKNTERGNITTGRQLDKQAARYAKTYVSGEVHKGVT